MSDDGAFHLDASGLPWAMFVVDSEGRIADANPALARLLGRQSARELLGAPVGGLLVAEDQLDDWLSSPRSVSSIIASPEGERRVVVDGRRRNDRIEGWILDGPAPDLPDVYTSLVENSPFSLVVIQDGVVVYANRMQEVALPSLGRRAADIVYQGMHPDDRALVAERIRAREAGDEVPEHYRFRQVVEGETVWKEVWSHRVQFRGRPAVQAITIDVNERVKAERKLAELDAKYHHSQKLEAVGRLAGGVAHDFNNLLTVMLASAQLAELESDVPEGARIELEQIRTAAARAAELTQQLLAFSRRQPIEATAFDAGHVVTGMESMLQRLIGENTELRTEQPQRPLWVELGEGQLEQIVANLVVNACDAMPLGGTIVVRSERRERGHPGSEGTRAYVVVSVEDSGVGIGPDVMPKIFEPFFTTKELGKGTGLGLSMVLGVAQNSGGFVEVDSTKDVGTTFSVFLPLVDAPADARELVSASSAASSSGRVLIVEDERLVRSVTERILTAAGYDVCGAPSGLEAMALIEKELAFDVVLTDVVMPGMSGFDLAQRLSVDHPHLPVVFMTGYADERTVPPGYELSEHSLLRKPFTPTALVTMISRAIEQREGATAASPN